MIIVLTAQATAGEIQEITERLNGLGYQVNPIAGVEKKILAAVGGQEHLKVDSVDQLRSLHYVEDVQVLTRSFRRVSREGKSESTIIDLGDGVTIGGQEVCVMAGPCTVESEPQLFEAAERLSKVGVKVLRGGAFKPCTSPYSFRGLGIDGLKLLRAAATKYGLKIVTEVMDPRKVELVSEYADILQIGTRNMQNYDLLTEVGMAKRPALLKRGMSAKYEEWMLAAEYIANGGNEQIILCERGIRTFETSTRNTLDIAAVPTVKGLSHLPIIVDPSQGTGRRDLVAPMSYAALAAGADGLIIEVHPDPERALKDGSQSISCDQFDEMIPRLNRISTAMDRTLSLSNPVTC